MNTKLPCKQGTSIDFGRDIKQYLATNFSQAVNQQEAASVDLLSQARAQVINTIGQSGAKLALCKYFSLIRVLEAKLGSLQSTFTYSNAFDRNQKITDRSLAYEKACVIWNLASALSGESVNTEKTEDGYSKRMILLKNSVEWLERLEIQIRQSTIPQNLVDINPATIVFFKKLFLAQRSEAWGQFVILRATDPSKISGYFLFGAGQYKVCQQLLSTTPLKDNKFLKQRTEYGYRYCLALSYIFRSTWCFAGLKYGEAAAYTDAAIGHLQECDKILKPSELKSYGDKDNFGFVFLLGDQERNTIATELAAQNKRSQEQHYDVLHVAYGQVYPLNQYPPYEPLEVKCELRDAELDEKTGIFLVPTPGAAPPAAAGTRPYLPIAPFATLVPADVKRYADDYQREIGGIEQKLYADSDRLGALRKATLEDAGVDGSVAQANSIVNNTSPVLLDPAAVSSAATIKQKGGYIYLQNGYTKLTELRTSSRQTIQQLKGLLESGRSNPAFQTPDLSARRAAQKQSLEILTTEGNRYEGCITAASEMDELVFTRIREIKPVLDAAYGSKSPQDANSTRELIAAVIANGGSLTDTMQLLLPNPHLYEQIGESLAALTAAINAYKSAESAYTQSLSDFRTVVSSINILGVLTNRGEKPLQKAVDDEKAKITPKVNPINEANTNCTRLVGQIGTLHQQLKSLLAKTNTATGVQRVNEKLITAGENFAACEVHLNKGIQYYTMIKNKVGEFNGRIGPVIDTLRADGLM